MRNIFIPILFLSLFVLSGCGSSLRIYSDMDEAGDFSQYTSYSFIDFTEGNKKTIPGMELERIRVAFAKELEQKGLHFVKENGDVSVKITVYHREAMDGYFGHPMRYTYMERAIAVDMYDNQSMKHVWHCTAVDELEYNTEERADLFPGVAAKIFEEYPFISGKEI